MVSEAEILSVPWITAESQLVPAPEASLTNALAQYPLSSEAIAFIQRHMLMEEKRAFLRFLSSPTSDKALRTFCQQCGRSEELLVPILNDLLADGIITLASDRNGEAVYVLTEHPEIRAVIDEALAAYHRYPELRNLLVRHNVG
ncbi:MAG: hypothetical protein RML36_14970 [Anaerolineae bacterium]|nr:hypothetical protein [Anaerolineae bacterium]MDW8100774.1 hypothetical protein [Anaerolineae bacterium]